MRNTKRATVVDALIAERVRSYRKLSGLSQMQVAEKLGVTFQQIQKYEKGANRIGAGRLFELAELLNVPVQELYPGSREDAQAAQTRSEDLKEIAQFAASAEGWRLFDAFTHVNDPITRKAIIALVQRIAGV